MVMEGRILLFLVMSLSIVDLCITCYKISPNIWLSYFCYEVFNFSVL